MSKLNQLFKAKIDQKFPARAYPCACKFECEKLGGNRFECDNCSYCGTAGLEGEPEPARFQSETVINIEDIF